MRVGKIGVAVISLVPFNVYGECTPAPDCASIGYTETSCEGDFVKCPFDTSKLFCIPCDSSFKYDCTGENITGGTGSACGGKYVACECRERTIFSAGDCICDTSCKTIGNIVYADRTCSSCADSNKTAVGVVVHSDNNSSLITNLSAPSMRWSSDNIDVVSLSNWTSADLAKEDMDGAHNSQLIREAFSDDNETNNAAWYCYNLKVEGFEAEKGKWYLPSAGEIYKYFYTNYALINGAFVELAIASFANTYWSSTEYDSKYAWDVGSRSGNLSSDDNKGSTDVVSCVLVLD